MNYVTQKPDKKSTHDNFCASDAIFIFVDGVFSQGGLLLTEKIKNKNLILKNPSLPLSLSFLGGWVFPLFRISHRLCIWLDENKLV